MKYYAVLLPMKDEQKSKDFREAHLQYLDKLSEEGAVVAKGRFTDGSGGMVIYRGASEDEVRQLAENDPYVKEGARGCDLREWVVTGEAFN
ncbi:hypothetical protein G4V62_16090 [Bacillaceae bacterium SIJ1]|uniref:YciI family protein n=1 Tax=Litoribacterium kuwaitense TaxID=1398745 RepID=UPI0013EA3792|nr:YciI family protein [Litoribacterium kuwaitense]NGP46392.1 hypothetical protein [Litoribacterium kuwaitense]